MVSHCLPAHNSHPTRTHARTLARAQKWKTGTVRVQTVANALGLTPRDVLRGFNGLQRAGVLRAEFSDSAYNLEV
jgi:predicted ArsR family transcriptional regulator